MATLLLVHAHPDDEAISTGGVMLKARAEGHRVVLDRKSTRLNSSHLVISYAVFCLKKKSHLHPERAIHLPWYCVPGDYQTSPLNTDYGSASLRSPQPLDSLDVPSTTVAPSIPLEY